MGAVIGLVVIMGTLSIPLLILEMVNPGDPEMESWEDDDDYDV